MGDEGLGLGGHCGDIMKKHHGRTLWGDTLQGTSCGSLWETWGDIMGDIMGGHITGGIMETPRGDITWARCGGTSWGDFIGGTFLVDMMRGHHGGTLSASAAGSGWLSSVCGHPPHTPSPTSQPHTKLSSLLYCRRGRQPSPRTTSTAWGHPEATPHHVPIPVSPSPSTAGDSPQCLHTATSTSHPRLGISATDGWSWRGGGSSRPPITATAGRRPGPAPCPARSP